MSFQSAKGLVTNGDYRFGGDGGFGADGGWQSTVWLRPGVEAVLKQESVGSGMTETPNGRIVGAAGTYVIANWLTAGDGLSAVHDLSTGAVRAMPAPDHGHRVRDPRPGPEVQRRSEAGPLPQRPFPGQGGQCIRPADRQGHLRRRRPGRQENHPQGRRGRRHRLRARGEEPPLTPVSVSAATGAATPLPETTVLPDAMAAGAGLFATYAGTDTMRLIVLGLKH
ncbi:hypothetical protein STANM309S_04532 [Streptomyces tanashiensis]